MSRTISRSFLLVLVAGMLTTGTVNTLLNKLQDLSCVTNCDAPDPADRKNFSQPLYQTVNMFIGEAMCLAVFYALEWYYSYRAAHNTDSTEDEPLLVADGIVTTPRGERFAALHAEDPSSVVEDTADHHNRHSSTSSTDSQVNINQEPLIPMEGSAHFLLFLPTLCDLSATTLMNVGLIAISASIYQMLRGSVVLFTGVLSTFFLNRRHPMYRWIALCLVFTGVAIVGLSGVDSSESSGGENHGSGEVVFGVMCVVLAQIFTASQFVIEEKLLVRYDLPALKAVGLEGTFGVLAFAVVGPVLYFTIGKGTGSYFDLVQGAREFASSDVVIASSVGIAFSIALFNFTGLAVTRNISATSRSTIDTCRTLFIWLVSLSLGWESFSVLQVLGFTVLLCGTFLFNDVFGTFEQ